MKLQIENRLPAGIEAEALTTPKDVWRWLNDTGLYQFTGEVIREAKAECEAGRDGYCYTVVYAKELPKHKVAGFAAGSVGGIYYVRLLWVECQPEAYMDCARGLNRMIQDYMDQLLSGMGLDTPMVRRQRNELDHGGGKSEWGMN